MKLVKLTSRLDKMEFADEMALDKYLEMSVRSTEADSGKLRRRLKGSDLHRAIINGDMEEIASLLKRGVPMEVQNSRGLTPLQVGCLESSCMVFPTPVDILNHHKL